MVVDPKIPNSTNVDAVIMGIRAARDAVAPDAVLTVTVIAVEDHIGATSELGHKMCGEGAGYRLFGQSENDQ